MKCVLAPFSSQGPEPLPGVGQANELPLKPKT